MEHGSHGSDQTLAVLPLPMRQIKPLFMTFWVSRILLQTKDGLTPILASKNENIWEVLCFKDSCTGDSGFWIKHHACLLNITKLKSLRERKPIPPAFFWMTQSIPRHPSYPLTPSSTATPPERVHDSFYIVAHLLRQKKNAHLINRNGLDHIL